MKSPTGRTVTSNPNLQGIPVRTEEGKRIREAFIAHPDTTFKIDQLIAALKEAGIKFTIKDDRRESCERRGCLQASVHLFAAVNGRANVNIAASFFGVWEGKCAHEDYMPRNEYLRELLEENKS